MFDSTPIENMFLIEYLPQAPDDCLRVYLYARMLCIHPEMGSEIADISKALCMEEEAVLEAFSFWERLGLVERMTDRPPTFSFRSLNGGVIARENDEVRRHLDYNFSVLKILDETSISSKQTRMLYDWLDVLGYSQEAALKILEHEKKVSSQYTTATIIKRADKRAVDWAERGIHTLEDVERAIAYDDSVHTMAYTILRHFGSKRKPSEEEVACVYRWINDWNLTEQDILEACRKTTNTLKPSFGYLDSILKNKKDGGNEHFDSMKAVLKDLGAANSTPTPELIKKYAALLEAGFEEATVLMAAAQCAAKGWHTFDKLEWMLQEWADSGVFTRVQAESYIANMQQLRNELRTLYKSVGMVRTVYAKDIKLYEEWKQKYNPELIHCAAQCALSAREPTKYMNKLLAEWQKAGIATPEAAVEQHRIHVGAAKAENSQQHNYQQHTYTEDDFGDDFYLDPLKSIRTGGDHQ